MKVQQQADLTALNTFGLAARASLLFEIESEEDLLSVPTLQSEQDLLLGGGSNILLLTDSIHQVLINRIKGITVIEQGRDSLLIEVGGGENWHQLVCHALKQGWYGLENLALIPGLVGAAPIQNIGAYGVELAGVLDSVTAWDWLHSRWVVFSADDCELSYRSSIFKRESRDRYFITSIRLRLRREFTPRLDYPDLRDALGRQAITAQNVFNTVVALRQSKLPDPAKVGNAGSFFKNPVLPASEAATWLQNHSALAHWPMADGQVKLSAAAMIEAAGMKGHARGAAAISAQHALVLVNLGGASGKDLWQLALEVQERVQQRYGITLDPEPRIFPSPAS